MGKLIDKLKSASIKLLVISFILLLITSAAPILLSTKNIFKIDHYYVLIVFIILIALNLLIAFVRVSDLKIPTLIKMKYFLGFYYNLPRKEFKSKLLELIDDYGKTSDAKNSIRLFLFYSTIYFYLILLSCLFVMASSVILILLAIPYQHIIMLPVSMLIVVVLIYGAYTIYNIKFSASMLSNLVFTFSHIRNPNTKLDFQQNSNTIEQLNERKPNYASLFNEEYKMHIPIFDNMLNELDYANHKEWYGIKSHARLYYDVMVGLGIMKKISADEASKCFSSRFQGIKHGTFKGKEQNLIATEKIRTEVLHVLREFH